MSEDSKKVGDSRPGMSNIKDMIAKRFALVKELADLGAAIDNEIVSLHATNKLGDTMSHRYRGGGEFVVDEVKSRIYYRKAGSVSWCDVDFASIYIEYSGRAIKKDGSIGSMVVKSEQDVGYVKLDAEGGAA